MPFWHAAESNVCDGGNLFLRAVRHGGLTRTGQEGVPIDPEVLAASSDLARKRDLSQPGFFSFPQGDSVSFSDLAWRSVQR